MEAISLAALSKAQEAEVRRKRRDIGRNLLSALTIRGVFNEIDNDEALAMGIAEWILVEIVAKGGIERLRRRGRELIIGYSATEIARQAEADALKRDKAEKKAIAERARQSRALATVWGMPTSRRRKPIRRMP